MPAKDVRLVNTLSLQTLIFQRGFAAPPLIVPILFFPGRRLPCIYHTGLPPRDFSSPVKQRKLRLEFGESGRMCRSTIFRVYMPLYPIVWHNFILFSTNNRLLHMFVNVFLSLVHVSSFIYSLTQHTKHRLCAGYYAGAWGHGDI